MSQRVRRARAAVISTLGAIFALTVGLNVSLDTFGSRWRDPEYGHRLRELKPMVKKSQRQCVVALGSSRSQMGFNPAQMGLDGDQDPLVYNLSQAGCGPPQQYMNLCRLLRDGVRLDYLLVEILPPVMANRGPIEKSFQVEKLSYQDLQTVSHYFSTPEALTKPWLEKRAVPWHTSRLTLISHVSPNWLRWQSRQDFLWSQMVHHGWMPYFHQTITEEKRQDGLNQARQQYLPYFPEFAIAAMPKMAHDDLLDKAKQNNIRVAFYTMPESPIFRSWYPAEVRSTLQSYYQQLEQQHGVPVFQCADWLDVETDFADGHHLMRSGSEKFSQRFGQDHLKPWLKRSR
jgi:hypothetical protein